MLCISSTTAIEAPASRLARRRAPRALGEVVRVEAERGDGWRRELAGRIEAVVALEAFDRGLAARTPHPVRWTGVEAELPQLLLDAPDDRRVERLGDIRGPGLRECARIEPHRAHRARRQLAGHLEPPI